MMPVEVPPPDDLTADWWEATREHRLTIQGCTACSGVQHPPRSVCTHCGRTNQLELTECAGSGIVDSFTVVHRAPLPGLAVPYVLARVRLDEGPVLLTHLVGRHDINEWCIDDVVSVDWVDLSDGRALPIFRPIL